MFTGLVETMGTVERLAVEGEGRRLVVSCPQLAAAVSRGDSVAVNGACLTVVDRTPTTLAFQVGPETLERTNLGQLSARERVNLERSLRVGDQLGGHWVQGHIDGVGRIAERILQDDWQTVWFTCDPYLTAQMVEKGSIAVDGVSLTLVEVQRDRFSVMLIPHTLEQTTLGLKPIGGVVNLETDILGKYVRKLLQSQIETAAARQNE